MEPPCFLEVCIVYSFYLPRNHNLVLLGSGAPRAVRAAAFVRPAHAAVAAGAAVERARAGGRVVWAENFI